MSAQAGDATNEVHFETVRMAWTADGLRERLKQARDLMTEQAAKLTRMLSHRGPDPDYDRNADEIAERVASIIGKRYRNQFNHYSNGNAPQPNGEKRLLGWILVVLASLTVSAIVGGVTLYGEFTALKATVTTWMSAHEQRINRLEAERDQRYRTTQPGAP
jgi:hypothetical protein